MYNYACWLGTVYTCLILIGYHTQKVLAAGDHISCFKIGGLKGIEARPADCDTAIQMIPSGIPQIDFVTFGTPEKPLNLELDNDGGRNLRLPAAFVASTCIVTVYANQVMYTDWLPIPRLPQKAATAMYYHFWPEVKAGAQRIVRECMIPRPNDLRSSRSLSGKLFTQSELEGWEFSYITTVAPIPEDKNWKGRFNVYEDGKVTWSSKLAATRAARDRLGASQSSV